MRIAFFTRCLPAHGLGGMEIHAEQVARGLAARGHRVVVYTTRCDPPGTEMDPSGGVTIHYLPRSRPRSYAGGYWGSSRAAFQRDHVRAPFDAIYSESAGAFGILISRSLPMIPIVVFLVGTARGEMRSKLRQPLTPRRILAIGWNIASAALSARCLPRATRILCESEGLRRSVLRENPACDPSRVSVAWLGVDTERFSPAGAVMREFDSLAPPPEVRVLFGGRLEREKGFDVAIHAVASLARTDVSVFLAGDGREKGRLIDLGRERLGERFHWLPPIPHERLPEMVRGATIYLMPTIRDEGSALSLVEAMACAKPVIASAVGGIPTVITNEEDGLLVPPGRVEPLAEAIRLLLDDPPLRGRIGERARRTAQERFALDAMIGAIERALRAE